MDFFEVVKKRKATRSYIPGKTIQKNDIEKILQIINLAPSAGNLQSYRLFVAHKEKTINKVSDACFNQRSDFVKNAACIFVFCANPDESANKYKERGKKLYAVQDATIAATYAILAATDLGYATCWVGNFKDDEMKQILQTDLPPVAAIIVGFPDEKPQRPPRKAIREIATTL